GIPYEDRRRTCANNLNLLGTMAASRGQLAAPFDTFMEKNRAELEKNSQVLVCPVAGRLPLAKARPGDPPPPWHSYVTTLPGPRFLAGDYRDNHNYADAN